MDKVCTVCGPGFGSTYRVGECPECVKEAQRWGLLSLIDVRGEALEILDATERAGERLAEGAMGMYRYNMETAKECALQLATYIGITPEELAARYAE